MITSKEHQNELRNKCRNRQETTHTHKLYLRLKQCRVWGSGAEVGPLRAIFLAPAGCTSHGAIYSGEWGSGSHLQPTLQTQLQGLPEPNEHRATPGRLGPALKFKNKKRGGKKSLGARPKDKGKVIDSALKVSLWHTWACEVSKSSFFSRLALKCSRCSLKRKKVP